MGIAKCRVHTHPLIGPVQCLDQLLYQRVRLLDRHRDRYYSSHELRRPRDYRSRRRPLRPVRAPVLDDFLASLIDTDEVKPNPAVSVVAA
jgi:hypothetical protein